MNNKYTAVYIRRAGLGSGADILTQVVDVMNHAIGLSRSNIKLFVDDNSSGSMLSPQFIRMMDEVREGKIDKIVMRDISRIARNCILVEETLRLIYRYNVEVHLVVQKLHNHLLDKKSVLGYNVNNEQFNTVKYRNGGKQNEQS